VRSFNCVALHRRREPLSLGKRPFFRPVDETDCKQLETARLLSRKSVGFSIAGQRSALRNPDILVDNTGVSTLGQVLQRGL
jgi:hypothetical protein